MSKVKHTPGPWETINLDVYSSAWTGVKVADCYIPRPAGVYDGGECEANARLIAAAPDLLNELKKVVNVVDNSDHWWLGSGDRGGVDLESILSVIAKAEGEEV